MKSYSELIAKCEDEMRAGRHSSVAKILSEVAPSRVPRQWRQPLANACWRAGLYTLGMKILRPVVYPKVALASTEATPAELSEYGVILQRNGSIEEALRVLARVDVSASPQALLYRAFCYFSRWEYELALPELEKYEKMQVPEYAGFVGKVNLAAALEATGRYDRAIDLLDSCIATAKEKGYTRLLANCHELRAQAHLVCGRLDEARNDLQAADRLFQSFPVYDELYVKKWKAVIDSIETGSIDSIVEFRRLALARGDWESVREADRFQIKSRFDERTFEHLVFGTPYRSYREGLFNEVGKRPGNDRYRWGVPGGRCLDLSSGALGELDSLHGTGTHRVMEILSRDFYKPLRMGELFDGLCPGERFDPASSPTRIHKAVQRTRIWLRERQLPARISVENGRFALVIDGPFEIEVPLEHAPVDRRHLMLKELRAVIPVGATFKPKVAREKTAMSRATFQRLTAWAVEAGMLEAIGSHKSIQYRFVGDSKRTG